MIPFNNHNATHIIIHRCKDFPCNSKSFVERNKFSSPRPRVTTRLCPLTFSFCESYFLPLVSIHFSTIKSWGKESMKIINSPLKSYLLWFTPLWISHNVINNRRIVYSTPNLIDSSDFQDVSRLKKVMGAGKNCKYANLFFSELELDKHRGR